MFGKHLTIVAMTLCSVGAAQTSSAALPDLGAPAAAPEGAPVGIETIDRVGLRDHAYWLASDDRGGRHTASKGQQETADYVAAHFKKLGLKPLGGKRKYLQEYPIERLVLHKSTGLKFGKRHLRPRPGEGFAVLHSSEKDKVSVKGRFVNCGNGATMPSGLKGRIPVIVWEPGVTRGGVGGDLQAVQRYAQLSRKLKQAGVKAAVVCLMDDSASLANTLNYRGILPDHGVMSFNRPARPAVRVPMFILNKANSEALLAHMQDDKASGSMRLQVQSQRKAKATNVCAVLEGTS